MATKAKVDPVVKNACIENYKLPDGKILVGRSCHKDGKSRDRFKWPTTPGSIAKYGTRGFDPNEHCGPGLYGTLWGCCGSVSMMFTHVSGGDKIYGGLYLVVEVDAKEAVISDKVKYKQGKVVCVGDLHYTMAFMRKHIPDVDNVCGIDVPSEEYIDGHLPGQTIIHPSQPLRGRKLRDIRLDDHAHSECNRHIVGDNSYVILDGDEGMNVRVGKNCRVTINTFEAVIMAEEKANVVIGDESEDLSDIFLIVGDGSTVNIQTIVTDLHVVTGNNCKIVFDNACYGNMGSNSDVTLSLGKNCKILMEDGAADISMIANSSCTIAYPERVEVTEDGSYYGEWVRCEDDPKPVMVTKKIPKGSRRFTMDKCYGEGKYRDEYGWINMKLESKAHNLEDFGLKGFVTLKDSHKNLQARLAIEGLSRNSKTGALVYKKSAV